MPSTTITPRVVQATVVSGGVKVVITPRPIVVTIGGNTGAASPPVFPGGTNGQVQANVNGGFGGLSNAALTALISVFDTTHSGAVPASGGDSTNFLRADGSWAVPPGTGGGGGPLSLAGDVTGTTDASVLATIPNVAGTYTNLNAVIDAKGRVIAAASGSESAPTVWADRAHLQAAIDAASVTGGVVTVLNTVALDGPLILHGSYVVLDCQGVGALDCVFPYIGAQLLIGPVAPTALSSNHYPASALDASTTSSPALKGLATLGTHTLLISSDGFAYGSTNGATPPLYYQDDANTLEACLVFPVTLGSSTSLMGFHDGTVSDPFSVFLTDASTISIAFTTSDGVQHIQSGPINQALAKSHFTWQRNHLTGLSTLFLNGLRIATGTIAAGLKLRQQGTFTPFLIGTTGGFAPIGSAPANLSCHGLKMSGGGAGRYDDANATQTLLRTGSPPTDHDRYLAWQAGDQPLIAYLPMTGSAVVPGTVPVILPTGQTVAFWCDSTRASTTSNYNTIRGMRFFGHNQATIFTAEQLFTTFEDCESENALNSFVTLQSSAGEKYITRIYNCKFSGNDAAIVAQNIIYETYGCTFPAIGREGIRESGCDATHYGRLWFAGPSVGVTRHIIDVHGGLHTSNGVDTDDENGGMVTGGSYYRYTKGTGQGRLQINTLNPSVGSVAYLQLVGNNNDGTFPEIIVGGLGCFGGQQYNTFLEITGTDCWIGAIDATGIGVTTVSGTAANLAIKRRDTAFLTGPKQGFTGSRATIGAPLYAVIQQLVALGLGTDNTTA